MRHEVIELPATKPPRRFTLRQIGELKAKAPEWIIRGLLEADSLALVFGDPGCGKSFLAVDVACCVSSGHDFHGRKVRQAPVIYIAGEGLNGRGGPGNLNSRDRWNLCSLGR